jgi:hypothetical protein
MQTGMELPDAGSVGFQPMDKILAQAIDRGDFRRDLVASTGTRGNAAKMRKGITVLFAIWANFTSLLLGPCT